MNTGLPTIERLHEVLLFDPETGIFRPNPTYELARKTGRPRRAVGHIHGADGYGAVFVDGKKYRAHRVAWAMHYGQWPDQMVDHRDGDRQNNRIDNLRLADNFGNTQNVKRYSNNTTGVRGITFKKGLFVARIWANKRTHYLGGFKTLVEATAARLEAQARLHGAFSAQRDNLLVTA